MSPFVSPESLVQAWLAEDAGAVDAAIFTDPFHVPYDRLTTLDGWVLWLGHPPVPDGVPLLPAPEHLIWGDPASAIATALLVGADYAARRGATDPEHGAAILRRESPVALVVPGDVHRSVQRTLAHVEDSGIPIVYGHISTPFDLRAVVAPFAARADAHTVDLGVPHDPVLSFQPRTQSAIIGGNSLSSFFVHSEPERDGVSMAGELNERVGIEIGVAGPGIAIEHLDEIEGLAAQIPSFIQGVSSWVSGESLAIGWDAGACISPQSIAIAFQAWLKALIGATTVDVRIVFAGTTGGSDLLSDMRARAAEFRRDRVSTSDDDTRTEPAVAGDAPGAAE